MITLIEGKPAPLIYGLGVATSSNVAYVAMVKICHGQKGVKEEEINESRI